MRGAAVCTGNDSSASGVIFACAGVGGRVKGQAGCAFAIAYIHSSGTTMAAVAVCGVDGIEPNTWYRLNKSNTFEKES
jgi:hypothetical protein